MDDRSLQRLLDDAAEELGVVGAQLALFDGSRQREFASGRRDHELGLAVTGNTLFQIGSTTKLFNAAMVLALVDARRLALDTPVREYVPDFRLADRSAERAITQRHLLSMTSGLDNGSYQDYGRGDDAVARYVAALAEVQQIFAPGSAFGYSNAGTNVSGHVASRVTGKTWERLVEESLLRPLGLTQCAMFAEDLLHHPVALGYERDETSGEARRVAGWGLPRSCAPAGGTLCCSAGDLVRFGRMFLDRGRAQDGAQVLSAAAIDAMQTPQVALPARLIAQKWCVGPFWRSWDGCEIFGHTGTNLGGSSALLWCPQKNVAIATTVNVPAQGYPLADRIFDVVFPQLFGIAVPAKPTAPARTDVDISRFVGRFEALGNVIDFSAIDGRLHGRFRKAAITPALADSTLTCGFVPLGDDRFQPEDPRVSGHRGWDVAFWGCDDRGRATHFLNGVFACRRTQ